MSGVLHDGGLAGLFDDIHVYTTDFTALNNSGVHGNALLFLDERAQTLTVDIQAHGLEPGQVHAQHIHGFDDDSTAQSPTLAQDADHDGFVELAEGQTRYGPIQLNLTLNPDDSVHDHGTAGHDHTGDAVFPTADADGNLHYLETFRFGASDPNAQSIFDGITPLDAKEVVLHGLTLQDGQGGAEGEADGTAGYKAVLPVASGELREVTGFGHLVSALLHAQHDGAGDWPFGVG
ncbi:MAG: hypothetical protein AAGC69_00075 [Paracraurococcus sp.]|jgi:hypothetical protein